MSLNINSVGCDCPVVADGGMCVFALLFNSSESAGDRVIQGEISDRICQDRSNHKIKQRCLNLVSVISISGFKHS